MAEGAIASRGASAAGDFASAVRQAAARPGGQEQFVGAIYNAVPTVGCALATYSAGQAQANQVCDSVSQMEEQVHQLGDQVTLWKCRPNDKKIVTLLLQMSNMKLKTNF